jgi:hypothetical protein
MATYKPLQSISLTAATSSVTFSGIDQSYTDLKLVISGKTTETGGIGDAGYTIRFNGNTDANYSLTRLYGDGATATGDRYSSSTGVAGHIFASSASGANNQTGVSILDFFSYSNTSTKKSYLIRSSVPNTYVFLGSGLWGKSTNEAIQSITLSTSPSWAAGTTFDLYGIKSGAPQALGGDTVVTDGTYWYHAFTSTGAFTPLKTLSADVLIVAGGGGIDNAPGGGAGGLQLLTSQSITASTKTITIGAGGVRSPSSTNGSNTSFTGFSDSVGGGRGTGAGVAGGSGSGAYGANLTGGAGTSGQGYKGGNAPGSPAYASGGGGGGAGGEGSPAAGSAAVGTGGAGGIGAGGTGFTNYAILNAMGVATSTGQLSGGNYYYAGGGGGSGNGGSGAGGLGGGGAGAAGGGANGTANTGGGAGAYWNVAANGLGGSGIVIVRYPV